MTNEDFMKIHELQEGKVYKGSNGIVYKFEYGLLQLSKDKYPFIWHYVNYCSIELLKLNFEEISIEKEE